MQISGHQTVEEVDNSVDTKTQSGRPAVILGTTGRKIDQNVKKNF